MFCVSRTLEVNFNTDFYYFTTDVHVIKQIKYTTVQKFGFLIFEVLIFFEKVSYAHQCVSL